MHAVVIENLEEYLAGTLEPVDQRNIEAHLSACEDCREEMNQMQEVSQLFVSLRPEEEWQPSPGFYAGVVHRVEEQVVRPSFASLFRLNFVFGRRLAFASLVILAVLGSYLVTRESEYTSGPSPETVMAEQNSPTFDSGTAHDNMLVTMTAYEQH
jgi:predicted anti-sigma-YlaC factor YlaD